MTSIASNSAVPLIKIEKAKSGGSKTLGSPSESQAHSEKGAEHVILVTSKDDSKLPQNSNEKKTNPTKKSRVHPTKGARRSDSKSRSIRSIAQLGRRHSRYMESKYRVSTRQYRTHNHRAKKRAMERLWRDARHRPNPTKSADIDLAEEYRIKTLLHHKDDNGNVSLYPICGTNFDDLPIAGGLTAYLEALSFFGKLFLIMFFISLPGLGTFAAGGEYGLSPTSIVDIMTLGNLGPLKNNTMLNDLSKKDIGLYVSYLDLFGVVVFWVALEWFSVSLNKKVERERNEMTTVQLYTVEVRNLPGVQVSRDAIAEYFKQFGKVVDVCILYDNVHFIDMLVELKKLEEMREGARHRGEGLKPYDKLIKEMKTTIKSHKEDEINKIPQVAYVSFGSTRAKERCLQDHYFSNTFPACTDREFYSQKIIVRDAPEPSNVHYKSLDFTHRERFFRRTWSFVFWGFLMLTCLAVVLTLVDFNASLYTGACDTQYEDNYIKSANASQAEIDCWCYDLTYQRLVEETSICERYLKERSEISGLLLASATIGCTITIIMSIVAPCLARFEQHSSKSRTEVVVLDRLFIGYFIITGVLITMVNLNLRHILNLPYWFDGRYQEFDSEWYSSIGFTITANMFMQILSIGCFPLLEMFFLSCRRRWASNKAATLTQAELNVEFEGFSIGLGAKYAYSLSTIFVALTYSPGIPIMLLVAAISFFVQYWVERVALLRHYKHPPIFDMVVSQRGLWIAKFSILVHLFMAYIVFGNKNILDSYDFHEGQQASNQGIENSFFNKIERWNSFPHFVAFFVIAIVFIITNLASCCTPRCLKEFGLGWIFAEHENRKFFEDLSKPDVQFETYHISDRYQYEKAFLDPKWGLRATIPFYAMEKYHKDLYGDSKKYLQSYQRVKTLWMPDPLESSRTVRSRRRETAVALAQKEMIANMRKRKKLRAELDQKRRRMSIWRSDVS